MTPTRKPFLSLSHLEIVIFYGLIVVTVAVFIWGAAVLIRKYVRGRRENVLPPLWPGIRRMLVAVATQSTVRRRDLFAGIAHGLILEGLNLAYTTPPWTHWQHLLDRAQPQDHQGTRIRHGESAWSTSWSRPPNHTLVRARKEVA